MSTQLAPNLQRGIVKQVLSGDIVIVCRPVPGKVTLEKQINISNITAPKLARRTGLKDGLPTKDEPFAFEAREFLRSKIIGKEVLFEVETKINNREYCTIYLGKDKTGENLTESLLAEGLVTLRESKFEGNTRLKDIQEAAKAAGKGLHNVAEASKHIRDVTWTVENPREFFQENQHKKISAVIEQIRDGSTVRALLLPDYYYITLMLSGIRCPQVKENKEESEPFGNEARNFIESKLLQRDVEIILETTSNQNFIGSVLHPNGNIAELLVREGFARCVDWSITTVTGGPEKLRAAERYARENKLRIWKNYSPSAPTISAEDKQFQAKVVEVVNGDALMIKQGDNTVKKIFLSSIRPPRLPESKADIQRQKGFRPLYDIPYMFETREYLRKTIGGKKINVFHDYTQAASDKFPEKVCCTVTFNGINVAESLVAKGLATVLRYKQDDDQRSSHYDDLLAAELSAQKSNLGLHNKKEESPRRVVDLYNDLQKSKHFLQFFQRSTKIEGLVEFVASGSRFRIFVPKDNCLLTFLLAGITCPRAAGRAMGMAQAEPFGEEALNFSKDLTLQKTVTIEVESMDKAGNYIGWLTLGSNNLSVMLVQEGLASVHISGERSKYGKLLGASEDQAKAKKVGKWASYEPPQEKDEVNEDSGERKVQYKNVIVTEVQPDLTFYAQHEDDGSQLEELLQKLRQELTQNPPLPHIPKRGELCAATFEDGLWYRAKVDKIMNDKANVTYVDYGNKETISVSKIASLPSTYSKLPAAAHLYGLACIKLPSDQEFRDDAIAEFKNDTTGKLLQLNVEYKTGGLEYATLLNSSSEDVAKNLVTDGYLMIEGRKDRRLQKLVGEYKQAEESAKNNRKFIWQYGDFRDDDSREFGFSA